MVGFYHRTADDTEHTADSGAVATEVRPLQSPGAAAAGSRISPSQFQTSRFSEADFNAASSTEKPPHGHVEPSKPEHQQGRHLTEEAWKQEIINAKHKPLTATVQGRLARRLITRGIFGAVAFGLGSRYAKITMEHYDPTAPLRWDQPTRMIAKGIDLYIARPLESIARMMGHDGKAFTTFRPTKRAYDNFNVGQHGITLGHEVVQMTADFAAASVGDAIGRDLVSAMDPNVKQNWIDEQGHIKYKQVLKNVAYNLWTYVTYNQGEDWAVAPGYVFATRAQRNFINWLSPGFKYDADRRLNGGSFKVNEKGEVTGTYAFEGAMDLQLRFTYYNIGTLMFRETYTEAADQLRKWYQSGMQLPSGSDINAWISHVPQKIGKTLRWAARDTIKGIMYMTPAVPAFWMFRTPQTKYRASFIHPEHGMICYTRSNRPYDTQAVHTNEVTRTFSQLTGPHSHQFTGATPTFFSAFEHGDWHLGRPVANPLTPYTVPTAANPTPTNKYPSFQRSYGMFDAFLMPFGRLNNRLRSGAHDILEHSGNAIGLEYDNARLRGKNLSDMIVNASFAYTPYFFMKSDVMAKLWDTGKMDMAIERAIDGVTHFNGKELKAGAGEIWDAMWHKPFSDPSRELVAQERICKDKSAADGQDYHADNKCVDAAIRNIINNKDYQNRIDAQPLLERIKDSRTRSKSLMDNFRKDEAQKFTHRFAGAGGDGASLSYAERELWKKEHSREDYPDLGTTLH